jgi:hypothetical protein
MSPRMQLKRKGQRAQARKDVALSTKFTPRFLDDADTRLHVVRLMRKRVAALMDDAGGHESLQREMLVKHATFMQHPSRVNGNGGARRQRD